MVAVLTGLATLVPNVSLAATAAPAVDNDGSSPFATYNMQGSNNGERWNTEVRQLAADNAVVALQEVGSGPPLPESPDRSSFRQIRLSPSRPRPLPSSVTQVTWPGGPNRSDRYVYFLQTDPQRVRETGTDRWQGGRVNLATVTDSPADEIRVLENPHYDPDPNPSNTRYRARPLLGLRFGNTWYWNTHARGHDVQPLLTQVRNVAAGDGRNWALVGDFNLNILGLNDAHARNTSLHLRDEETLARTNQATFINGNNPSELDYAVTHGLAGFHATVPQGRGSDHAPVYFGRTAPPSRLPSPSHTYGTVLSTPTGRLLQDNPDDSFTVGDAGYGDNQTFQMYTTGMLDHFIQNTGTKDCIAIAPKVRRDVSARTVAGDCGDPRAQWSVSELKSEEGDLNQDYGRLQRWRNVASPDSAWPGKVKQSPQRPALTTIPKGGGTSLLPPRNG
ncbi:endonuclease/exonuclease/phosphatase family protein [Streptomyces sp. Ac-502]|uniref:endonuclease/exonuclease/phosphatase family protein n=1 Tax=Streptomyces sp. Ac-502 TaxID=3342801 RepID=UPI003862BBC2